jgi:aminocarboxymuconate-semialdehyde decarboxylase
MIKAGPIDIHAHFLPLAVLELCESGIMSPGVRLIEDGQVLKINQYRLSRVGRRDGYIEDYITHMDKTGVAVQVLSPNPIFFHDWEESQKALKLIQAMNDGIAEAVSHDPERFMGLALTPLQDTDMALRELERAVDGLGLVGLEIGSHVNSRNLDDSVLDPFFEEVARKGIPVQVHPNPHAIAGHERMGGYHLANLIGNLVETSIAAGCVIFGGVLERHPALRIEFAHGGGLVPYQIGRWNHGYTVRTEGQLYIKQLPKEFFAQCWFDTIVHSDAALAYLLQVAGENRVMLGTDFPADMADGGAVERVRRVAENDDTADKVLTRNAHTWLRLTDS